MDNYKKGKYCRLDEKSVVIEDGYLDDIKTIDLQKQYLIRNAKDKQGFIELKSNTPARIGIGHAGPRYRTQTSLRFREDHSAAQDSVFSYVANEFLERNTLYKVKTLCKDREEFVTRPDKGRIISNDGIQWIEKNCIFKPKVQIIIADGLSAKAIEANAMDTLYAIMQGLDRYSIDYGTVFFVENSRVATEDKICEVVQADVICQLIGERPGLVTAESMSAYIAYKATVGMNESRRTVISNIHKGGTLAVEAGAHIADVIKLMLEKERSGVDLKL